MPVSTTVSTGQYHSAVICAQRTRRAAPRRKGRSVRRISLVGLRNDASALATFQMAANCAAAKQVPRCLQSVQPMQAVDCTLFRSLSLVVLLSGTVAHPVCHCWCDSSHLVVVVLVLQPASCRLQLLCFTLFTCAPRSASHAVRSSPCYHQSALLSCAIWPCSAFCTDTASAPRSAHHYHPLCPLPRRPGTFSDQHTDATDCSPRRNLLKAIRLHLFSTALRQAIARRKPSVGGIQTRPARDQPEAQVGSRRVRYSRSRPCYAASSLSGCE
jgi:hypothetical protein